MQYPEPLHRLSVHGLGGWGGDPGWGEVRTSTDSNFQISWGALNTFQIKICWINILLSWFFKFKPFLGLGMAHSKVSSEMKDLVARNLQKKGKQEVRICSGDQMNPQRLGGNRELSQLLTKAPPPSPGKHTWKNNWRGKMESNLQDFIWVGDETSNFISAAWWG